MDQNLKVDSDIPVHETFVRSIMLCLEGDIILRIKILLDYKVDGGKWHLYYLIQLWGGAEKYLFKALQVLQNRFGRDVTRKSWFTSTRFLLRECNWLSVNQLVFYQTVLTDHPQDCDIWNTPVSCQENEFEPSIQN